MKKTPEEAREEAIKYFQSDEYKAETKGRYIFALCFSIIILPSLLILKLFSINIAHLTFWVTILAALMLTGTGLIYKKIKSKK